MSSLLLFNEILNGIPNYDRYRSVEDLDNRSAELAKEFPSIVKLIDLGKTAGGKPISVLRIGSGRHNALLYGFPNPEEPLGGLLLDYFSRALAENHKFLTSMDYTWYMIKCADPDGAELNKGYLDGPYIPYNFALNFYRTPINSTGSMVFPYRYGSILDANSPTAETLAMMKIMDQNEIHFMSGLHVLRFGGVTFQVSEPCPELYSPLQMIARESHIPLRKRPGTMLAEGVQLGRHLTPARNFIRAKLTGLGPLPKISGARMIEYERLINPNCFDLVPESSTWYDPRCYDNSSSDTLLGEAISYASMLEKETNTFILNNYSRIKSHLSARTRFLEMVEDAVDSISTGYYNIFDPPIELSEKDRKEKVTVAQEVEIEGRADIYYSPCYVSMMIRAIDEQVKQQRGTDTILTKVREDLSVKFEELKQAINSKYDCKHYPLKNLIRMDLGSVLYSACYAIKRNASFQMWH